MESVKNYPQAESPLLYLLKKTWHYSYDGKKNIIIYWILFIFSSSIDLFLEPFILAAIIKTVTESGITEETIVKLLLLLGGYFLSTVSSWIFHGPARVMERTNAFKVRANYKKFLMHGIMNLSMKWHVDHHSGDTIDKVEKGTDAIYSFSSSVFIIIRGFFKLIGSYIVLAYFSLPAAVLVVIMIAITFWVITRLDTVIINQHRQLNHHENNITENIFDTISNITTVIILRAEKMVCDIITRKIDKPYELYRKHSVNLEVKWFVVSMCCNVMIVLVLGIYFVQHINTPRGVLVGSVYLLIKYLDTVSELFYQFTSSYGDVIKNSSKLTNSEELVKDFVKADSISLSLSKEWNCISVEGLSFSYENEEASKYQLNDISFKIEKGKKIACIGKTGSGKTTLLKIIRGLYSFPKGNVSVDNIIQKGAFLSISGGISLIPQTPEIFATTVLGNITFSKEDEYDKEAVQKVMHTACFDEVLEYLPYGLETSMNEKGVNLSGGQQQRLALARGLYASKDAQILLLDEPTSSLDSETERRVYENIFLNCSKDLTIISTVHRLHLLPLFDEIIFFEKGKIIDQGSYDKLLLNRKFVKLIEKMHFTHESKILESTLHAH